MILIRGFNQEGFARDIEKGRIGFHDLLTTLLYPENNGYKLSDYYEESLIEAASMISPFELDCEDASDEIKRQLNLLFNPFIPHFYLSYFHILNHHSENWLDQNFSDDSHFIYAIPKLQKLDNVNVDEMLYGRNMIGSRMVYLPKEGIARTNEMAIQKAGMVYLMQNELDACHRKGTKVTLDLAEALSNMIIAVCCEAFARRCDDRFDESENEFRIIYKTPTPYSTDEGIFDADKKRPFSALVDGIPYEGTFFHKSLPLLNGYHQTHNLLLETHSPMVAEPITTIKHVIDSKRNFKLLPHFLSVNIMHSFSQYGYIGNKEKCREFIEDKLKEGT